MVTNLDLGFQVFSLIMLSLLHVMFRANRKIFLIRDRVFYITLNLATSVVVFDLIHILAINLYKIISDIYILLIARFYLLSVVVFTSCILLYTLSEIYQGKLFADRKRYLYILVDALAFPVLLNMPLYYTINSDKVYVHGSALYSAVGMGIFYLLLSIWNVSRNYKVMNRSRSLVVIIACIILIVATIGQIMLTRKLMISPIVVFVMVYMYFCLEPPGEYLDGILGVFNYDAYHLYINNRISNNKGTSLLYVKIIDYSRMQSVFGNNIRNVFLKRICAFFLGYSKAKVFYLGNGEFVLAFEKSEYFIKYVQQIRKRLSESWNISEDEQGVVEILINSVVLAYPSERMEENLTIENVSGTLDYYTSKYRSAVSDVFVCIDRKELREKARYDHVVKTMDNSIAEDRISVYYQAIYSVELDRTVALEALMRVQDDRGVFLQNEMVIDYAERTGRIRELGNVVLKKICSFLRTHSLYELEIYTVHINLSVLQCQDARMAGDFLDIMENYQLPASMFVFEISGALTAYTSINLKKNMDRLTEVGAQFILDNYGQDTTSIERMLQMNLSMVKFGPNTVGAYFANAKVRNAIRTNVNLMKQVNIGIMAVGIENQMQYNELKKLGVSHMQGALFYKPMDGISMLKAITKERDKGMEREALYESVL